MLNLRADATPKPPELHVRLIVTNQGKEEAHNIQVSLRNGGEATLAGPSLLAPGAAYETETNLSIGGKAPGNYPLFVTVGYADRNGYQFSAILCAPVSIQQNTSSDLFGTLKTTPLADTGQMQLRLKNLAPQGRAFTLTLFTPRELSADYDEKMALKPNEEKSVTIPLRNFSALPGSHYPVYAVLEYEKDGRHFTHVILAHVDTVARTAFFTRYRFWILGVAGAFLLLGILIAVLRSQGHSSPQKSAPSKS
ncbi:MAG: hypothetical protein HY652_14475 [Acidobacteria bacterium]|nr:hypothetical protein [Acidobacteriota bacterium]